MEASAKYTVCIPGIGNSSSCSITGLSVNGLPFARLVETVVGRAGQTRQQAQTDSVNPDTSSSNKECTQPKLAPFNMVWLDIERPTKDDIVALSRIFDIDGAATERLLKGAGAGCLPGPECLSREGGSLYACWAETTTHDASTKTYLDKGVFRERAKGSRSSALAGGGEKQNNDSEGSGGWIGQYIPMFPWLQPSATEIHGRFHLQKKRQSAHMRSKDPEEWKLESARRQHVDQIFSMIYRLPAITNKDRTLQAIDRWGPGHEQWRREVVNSADASGKQSRSESRNIADQIGRDFQNLIGYRLVQVWICGPIALTFHASPSAAIRQAMQELVGSPRLSTKVAPLAVIQSVVGRWVHATKESLWVLERYADKLDHDLSQPVQIESLEAANWTPVIARCRKVSLALLRRCQTNEAVLIQMCKAAHTLILPQMWLPNSMRSAAAAEDFSAVPIPLGRPMSIGDIIKFKRPRHQLGVFVQQKAFISDTRKRYKQVEQRLSRLHRILLDRQRLRLLAAQKDIQQYFRILVTVEIVFLPIELWHNLDNLNGIATPGALQPNDATDEDFWLTVLGCLVWAISGVLLYTLYIKFFERTPTSLRMANIASLQRKTRHLTLNRSAF
ncbi:hypothetical protein EV175_002691 [Coemansia sp. RSA 1933]|nr:hypothetical protein EV175_002691 [Coemansia sp. RSA 1933]